MALFDLSKAFDRMPHSPLLLKLRAVGLSGPLHSWFRSYLSDRSKLVAVHGVNSPPVFSGVPQGSDLGPLLFPIYVNDLSLCNFSNVCSLVLFAEGTTLYKPIYQSIDLSDFQSDINIIHNWFSSNHLTANAAKPNSWSFQPRRIHSLMLPCSSTIKQLSRFHQLNFLGFGSPVLFPGMFRMIIFVRKLV